jgi:hypothetical protein
MLILGSSPKASLQWHFSRQIVINVTISQATYSWAAKPSGKLQVLEVLLRLIAKTAETIPLDLPGLRAASRVFPRETRAAQPQSTQMRIARGRSGQIAQFPSSTVTLTRRRDRFAVHQQFPRRDVRLNASRESSAGFLREVPLPGTCGNFSQPT